MRTIPDHSTHIHELMRLQSAFCTDWKQKSEKRKIIKIFYDGIKAKTKIEFDQPDIVLAVQQQIQKYVNTYISKIISNIDPTQFVDISFDGYIDNCYDDFLKNIMRYLKHLLKLY